MLFYFSERETLNLSHIPQIKNVRTYKDFRRLYNTDCVKIQRRTREGKTIYPIEVSLLVPQWTGDISRHDGFSVILNISEDILELARRRLCRILIISIVEGDSFVSNNWDGYLALHHDITQRKLPPKSVIIIAGNLKARQEYTEWCKQKGVDELLDIYSGIGWDGKSFYDGTLCIDQKPTKPINSLNRAPKLHREKHVTWLKDNDLVYNNLVSGYGYTVDLNDTMSHSLGNITNRDIYNQTMLSVVTESHFYETGLFITEKTFRSIAIGHPAVILGQPNLLDYLDSIGFNLRWPGLNTTYDAIIDNDIRFEKFHRTVYEWCTKTHNEREQLRQSWKPIIKQNADIFKKLDFKKLMMDTALLNT